RAVFYAFYDFLDDEGGYEEPFPWSNGVAEAVLDGDVCPGGGEYAVQEPLEVVPVHVVELVCRDCFDVGKQEGGVLLRIGDSPFHAAGRDADFVEEVPVPRDAGVVAFAAQYVDEAGGGVVLCRGAAEQGCDGGVQNDAAGVVLGEFPLQCAPEEVA